MCRFETDFTTVAKGFTGKIVHKFCSRRRTYLTLIGRDDTGKPVILKVRLAAGHRPQDFRPGRDIRVTEVVGKLGRELILAFPVGNRTSA